MKQMLADLQRRKEEAEDSLEDIAMPRELVGEMLYKLDQQASSLLDEKAEVLSHGDLHLGNYAIAKNGKLYILDWEHAHLNVPYWDLYHLLDMSHPRYPKQITPASRERILRYYLKQSAYYGKTWNEEAFIRDYCLFAAAFSLWMLILISDDLLRGNSVWSKEELLSQRNEVKASLSDCWSRAKTVHDQGQGHHLLHNTERAGNQ
ncbi:phosphotransferase family protein [Paenibacillus bouchesdurhonensis]|uniref:phosphotransferase family protein n=1 Tax=Paenibacillus bouchesdurhonensis TaxID=1870990 RepID=UPI000DA5F132|nr:phosphotransferase [Paenibacillus bouchesdurhonensis]